MSLLSDHVVLQSVSLKYRNVSEAELSVSYYAAGHAENPLCRAKKEPYIASMGIYVCKATAIHDLLVEHFPTVSSQRRTICSKPTRWRVHWPACDRSAVW